MVDTLEHGYDYHDFCRVCGRPALVRVDDEGNVVSAVHEQPGDYNHEARVPL